MEWKNLVQRKKEVYKILANTMSETCQTFKLIRRRLTEFIKMLITTIRSCPMGKVALKNWSENWGFAPFLPNPAINQRKARGRTAAENIS
jgi:hypothetical protein